MSRIAAFLISFLIARPAFAMPENWEVNLQESASTIQDKIIVFHDALLIVISLIVLLVLGLLVWIIVRFNHKANPIPATFTHNRFWERLWTIVPLFILVGIAFPSYFLMEYQGKVPEPGLTIKVTGYQWYWGYEYPDQGLSFSSYMVPEEEIDPSKGQIRLLSVDNAVYVPVDTNVQILATASDVIHSWAVQEFGVKKDAVPGRLNETWFRANKIGVYYGQCSEICGTGHAYMPIEVHVVSKEDFAAWVAEAKVKFGALGTSHQVASAE